MGDRALTDRQSTAARSTAIQRLRNTVAEFDDLPPDTPIDLREREFAGTDSIQIAVAELGGSHRKADVGKKAYTGSMNIGVGNDASYGVDLGNHGAFTSE